MRFKAVLTNQRRLLEVTKLLEKLGKSCIVHLKARNYVNIVQTPVKSDDAHIWTTLQIESLFSEYRIESKTDNEISFEVELVNLTRALKSAEGGRVVTMKLTKKQDQPYLTFEILNQAPLISVTQDVPIAVFSAGEMSRYAEPNFADPQVRLIMPSMKSLANVVERCKSLSDIICIRANMNGELELGVDTQMVRTATHYKNLDLPRLAGQPAPRRDSSLKAEAKLDIVLFSKVLSSHSLRPKVVFCGFVDQSGARCLVWHMALEDGAAMTFYLPVFAM